ALPQPDNPTSATAAKGRILRKVIITLIIHGSFSVVCFSIEVYWDSSGNRGFPTHARLRLIPIAG
ncbi:MAG: hypothetical protein ACREEM_46590, partial [Blastocatellia bacterium]